MYSKQIVTKSINKHTKFEEGYIVSSGHYDLPQKRVLFITKDEGSKITTLKIFSIHDLNACLVEKTLRKNCSLLGILPDGSILLNQDKRLSNQRLIKLCPESLDILSSQQWQGASSIGVIDNESFFVINSSDSELEHYLSVYKWEEGGYVEVGKEELLAHPKTECMGLNIISLGKNRYCYEMIDHYTKALRVLIFEIDTNLKIKELGIIEPKAQPHRGSGSAAVVALPNGKLLTYYECYDNVQVWDSETLDSIKKWNWANIQTPEKFSIWGLNIISFPNTDYLLIQQGGNFYLFNTDKLVMKHIELAGDVECYGKTHILPNGRVISFVTHDKDFEDYIKVASFDLPEIVHYRKMMAKSQISDQFFSQKLTPDIKEELVGNADDSDSIEDNKKQDRCLCM